jgi:cobalt-zinc-cadmium efflux system outer membrane protein
MSGRLGLLSAAALTLVACLIITLRARAQEAGTPSDAGADAAGEDGSAADAASDDAGSACSDAGDDGGACAPEGGTAEACDGALCNSLGLSPSVPGTCAVGRGPGSVPLDLAPLLVVGGLVALGVARRARRRPAGTVLLSSVALMYILAPQSARAADTSAPPSSVVPPPTELPQTLSLDDALRIFRAHGLDLLIAEAAVRSAEGATRIAGAVPNPVVGGSFGWAFTYQKNDPAQSCTLNNAQCSNQVWNANISDSAAIEDSVSGKRDLRLKVARNALAAAKLSRVDAERTIAFQVKSAYVQVAQAVLGYKFAKEVADSNTKMYDLFKTKFASGAINEGDLARIETQKLESDQALDSAFYALREGRVALAFLLGVRGAVPEFDVDTKVLDYSVPAALGDASEERLLRTAFEHRPDLRALGYQKASSAAQVELTSRQRFPDVTLSLGYATGGYGGQGTNAPLQSPMVTVGASAPLPVFYQLQGELGQARAQDDTNALQQAKTTAQVISDVSSGFASYSGSRRLVERMERGGLLRSARTARDITRLQYEKGAASLTDYLTALQAFIATNVEYIGDLGNYWTAVFQLEEAVATDLR